MKKLLFVTTLIFAPYLAYGDVDHCGGDGSCGAYLDISPNVSLGIATPGIIRGGVAGKYYKCTAGSGNETLSHGCGSGFNTVQISYNLLIDAGHLGTRGDPFILNGCHDPVCVCNQYQKFTGNGCASCPTGYLGSKGTGSYVYHQNSDCGFCVSSKWKNGGSCDDCPINATCDGEKFYCNVGYYKSGNECKRCPDNADTCEDDVGFVCKNGFYTNGDKCAACPVWENHFTNSAKTDKVPSTSVAPNKNAITDCYIQKNITYYDVTGTLRLTEDCSYSN